MKTLNISEARNALPTLVESVASTRTPVVLLRYGKPAAMMVPIETEREQTNPYPLRGVPITVADDFDAPLAHLWEACKVAGTAESYGSPNACSRGKKGKGKKA